MRITIVALGHRMPAWVTMGYDEYERRLPREFPLELIELKPEPRSRGKSSTQVLAAEAVRIRAACAGCTVVALDENGSTWTTLELAGHIGRWRDEGARVAFIIGSADGLAPSIKSTAFRTLALSALTLPHGLVRVLLAEQVYRAASLLAGHPYHRA
ncbi:MAG: 23S rRNA (pseudouridine(1915)-N(3))-methyltransferase RlmH [Betaproteobacteria bacterium]|nr:23S rRNA (pseudouridine(1915)-N(3))-methyltransferase RlmH [Betaproteobacteria bacterium]